ncbi:MAG: hypothetical protein ACP5OG_00005 [Candidatus Nanoarchaeia archaeon]
MNKLFCIFVIALVLVSNAYAMGITPGRTTINFSPGLEREVKVEVLNNEHKDLEAVVMIQGELNSSISVSANKFVFSPTDEFKSFNYKVKLPKSLEPGLHTAEVVVLEIPKANPDGTFVGATGAVVSQVYIYVPYPGKYADFDINVLNAEQNTTATFVIPVINRGKVGIGKIRAVIDVFSPLNEKIGTINTDEASLASNARTELSANWNISANIGSYIARVTVFYDGESRTLEKIFSVGAQALSVDSITVNNFELGQIAKIQILVDNKWNEELTGVFANLLVYNKENQVMADVKSSSENIAPLSKKELVAYWDTVGVSEGEYNGKLLVKYGQKSTDRNLVLSVRENSLDITGVGYAIKEGGGKGTDIVTILVILVVLLLLVNLAWFVFFNRMKSKKK